MSLSDVIEYVKRKEKTLVVFNPPADSTLIADLRDYFSTQNVTVTGKQTSSGEPQNVAVLRLNGDVLASVPVAQLRELLTGGGLRETGVGIDDTDYHEILQHLKETTFTSYDKAEMVNISHEIEDRALRVGSGRLLAGFQESAKLARQADRYERLATKPLDIHTFAIPGDSVDVDSITHHTEATAEIRESWFVVFDGDGENGYKTALLATEQTPNQFYGFWSDDPEIVDTIGEYLETTYLTAPPQ
ncbi:DICT sensory domain-containing protein [Halonotius terrestris]|nr:DICT sensory domain-containing protein [Halonotius terrestris]